MQSKLMKLLVALCASSVAFAASTSETNRPFIKMRHFRNYAEAMTSYHKALALEKGDRLGAFFQLVPFYQKMRETSKDEIGKGFGVNHKNTFKMDDSAAAQDLDSGYFLHDYNHETDNPAVATVTLSPEHKAYGINLYHIDRFDDIADGLFFCMNTGLVKAEHTVNPTFADLHVATGGTLTLQTYLDGSLAGAVAHNLQAQLDHGKINTDSMEQSGFNDVELGMGWQFVRRERANLSASIDFLIPTGKEPTGEFLFEPLYGSRHWQLGGTLSGDCVCYKGDNGQIKMVFEANYRYAFQRTIKRLLTLKSATFGSWGHYNLIANTALGAAAALTPAANVLARDVKVTPGHMLDGSLMVSLDLKNFALDAGYNLYACQAENVDLVDWTNDYYFRVAKTYDTSNSFATNQGAGLAGTAINKSSFDTTSESQIIHRIFGGAGIVTTEWDYPMTIGLGASYEIVQGSRKQITPETWEVWGKLGVNF